MSNKREQQVIMMKQTHVDLLSACKAKDLHAIRKNLHIRNASSLKKQELIERLATDIPMILPIIIGNFDQPRISVLEQMLAGDGKIAKKDLRQKEINYFVSKGFVFHADEQMFIIPSDLQAELKYVLERNDIKEVVKRNTEWIHITHGLLYHYGVISFTKMYLLLQKYVKNVPDFLTFSEVIDDSLAYYNNIDVTKFGFYFKEVVQPKSVFDQQETQEIDYYPLRKERIIEAGVAGYVEHPQGFTKLVSMLTDSYQLPRKRAIKLVESMVMKIKSGYQLIQLIQWIQRKITFTGVEDAQKFADSLIPMKNHTRKWTLKGYISIDEYQKLNEAPETNDVTRKIGRNEPCLCGSGKKYKKCCGK